MVSRSVDQGGGGVHLLVGHALVLHVGDEAVLVVGVVGDDLHAAVGQLNAVLAWNNVQDKWFIGSCFLGVIVSSLKSEEYSVMQY